MNVTIIGTGNMGRGIGSRLVSGGHSGGLLGTERSNAEELAADLGGSVRAGTIGDPIDDDVVVFAVWYPVTLQVATQYGSQLDGKVVVDISNPLDTETFEPIVPDAGSGAEELASAVPGARVVKAFNTTFAGTLASGEVSGQQLDVLLASDDEDAKRTVTSLVESSGLRAVDAGPLRRARQLEALGYLHIAVQEGLGTGYGSAVKIVG